MKPDIETDVLLCVGPADINHLFLHSLTSCVRNLRCLRRIFIATPDRSPVLSRLKAAGDCPIEVEVLEDSEILSPGVAALPGWCRQQAVKLAADQICGTRHVVCLGADTILLREVRAEALFVDGDPILYYNRYLGQRPHLEYERRRVRNVAGLLGVTPARSLPFGDFVMDLMVFDAQILRALRARLQDLHGEEPLLCILPGQCSTLEEKAAFGEWALYAVFLLDVLGASPPIRNSDSVHLAQVHSNNDLQAFNFSSRIVHFVDKGFDRRYIHDRLIEIGLTGRFP